MAKHIQFQFAAITAITFVLAGHAPSARSEDALGAGPSTYRRSFQDDKHCGPNSLYALLRLYGVDVAHADVVDSITLDDRGCNVADLQRAAAEYNVELQAIRIRPEELRTAPLPAIVHYGTSPGDIGHFFVLLNVETVDDADFMQAIDSSAGQYVVREPMRQFYREWDGILLVPHVRSTQNTLSAWGWGAAVVGIVLNVVVYTKYVLAQKPGNRRSQ